MARKQPNPNTLHPIYWPNWLAIGLLRVVALLPFTWQLKFGAALGHLAYYLAPSRKHIATINMNLCFPDKSESERQALVRQVLVNSGIGIMETSYAWNSSAEKLLDRCHFYGLENLAQAAEANQSVLLLGMHFSTLDLCGALLAQKIPFHVMYRKNKNPVLEKVMSEGRQSNFPDAIERSNIRGVIKALKNNQIVWYGPDQDYGRKQSVFAPFFNISTASITATARIVAMTNAKVIPFYHRRDKDNHYHITLGSPLESYPTGDDVVDATTVNHIVERAILEAPDQYWWVHRRFKTRPEGENRPY